MNHRNRVRKLSKTPAHRKAMLRNMMIALFREKRIKTTLAKAKVLRRFAEKTVTRARKDTVHNRRMARRWVADKKILGELFTEIGPRYAQRTGGYTRIIKLGRRVGDAAEMAYIAFVQQETAEEKSSQQSAKPKKKRKAVEKQ